MKKSYDYKQVSSKTCKDCGKPLKKNLLNSNPDTVRCWVCWRIARGLFFSRGKDLRRKQTININKYKIQRQS
jgi:hypothetical protein